MLRKRGVGVMAFLVGLVLVFGLVGCDTGNELGGGGGDDGWPPSSELSKFLLGGWTQPTGISGITWGYTSNTAALLAMQIQFSSATADTADAINDYITKTGGYQYSSGFPMVQDQHYHSVSEKADATYDYVVNYTFDVPDGGGIQIFRSLKGGGGDDGGGLPGPFSITGCPFSTGSVYATTANPATLLAWYSDMANSQGIGALSVNNTVLWGYGKTPPNGTYTIIVVDLSETGTYYKATGVSINNGGGSAAWNQFNVLPNL